DRVRRIRVSAEPVRSGGVGDGRGRVCAAGLVLVVVEVREQGRELIVQGAGVEAVRAARAGVRADARGTAGAGQVAHDLGELAARGRGRVRRSVGLGAAACVGNGRGRVCAAGRVLVVVEV